MTLNAFTSISLDPLLVVVALGRGSRTLSAVRASGRFSISVLSREQREVAVDFATPGGLFPTRHTKRTADDFPRGRRGQRDSPVRGAGDSLPSATTSSCWGSWWDSPTAVASRWSSTAADSAGVNADAFVPPGHPIALYEGAGW